MSKERATFQLLWNMIHAIDDTSASNAGTVIGRYAGMIDDRIENSGYSRSVDSLKMYTTEQLQAELDSREVTPDA